MTWAWTFCLQIILFHRRKKAFTLVILIKKSPRKHLFPCLLCCNTLRLIPGNDALHFHHFPQIILSFVYWKYWLLECISLWGLWHHMSAVDLTCSLHSFPMFASVEVSVHACLELHPYHSWTVEHFRKGRNFGTQFSYCHSHDRCWCSYQLHDS